MGNRRGSCQWRCNKSRRGAPCAAAALTLVEVLLAITLGAVVTSTAAIVSVQAVRSRRAAEMAINDRWDRHRVLAQFRQDVDSRLRNLPGKHSAIQFPDSPEKLIEITALTLVSTAGPDPGTRAPAKITYLSQVNPREPSFRRLVRRVEPLVEPQQPAGDAVLADHLETLTVERLEEKVWIGSGTAKNANEPKMPAAVRIQIRRAHSKDVMDVATVSLSDDVRTKPPTTGA